MSTETNLYIEKIYAEHPLSAWTLDEQVGFISLITEANRKIEDPLQWSLTNTSASSVDARLIAGPIDDAYTSKIILDNPAVPAQTAQLTSAYFIDVNNLDFDLASWAIGMYFRIDSVYVGNVYYGYQYVDGVTLNTIEVIETKPITDDIRQQWIFAGSTFDLPPANAEDVQIVIRFDVISGGGANDYNCYVHGLSVAQWSEQFNQKSVGVTPTALLDTISLPSTITTVTARPYGEALINGYYLTNGDSLRAINFGVPLAFGSSSVTKILPNVISGTTYPSLIFPGYGFLNNIGRYNQYTVEMWLRLNNDYDQPIKFFGPIASDDGLYVEGPFLTLVIGNQYKSHYVGEWFRPMLIQIRVIEDLISLVVNGEQIFNIAFDDDTIAFPSEFDGNGKSQDWLGFYGNENLKSLEIDSFVIYTYPVPNELAKRRWVWGQGVPTLETVNSSLNSISVFSDYSFSNYAVNYTYPDFGNWKQGFFDNINTTRTSLQMPDYELPLIILDDQSLQTWYDDLNTLESAETTKYFTFRPNSNWDNKSCRFAFNSFGLLSEPVRSFYAIVAFDPNIVSGEETIFEIKDPNSGNYFNVKINYSTSIISYNVVIDDVASSLGTREVNLNDDLVVGLDISKIESRDITNINKLFVAQSNMTMLVGGDLSSTFTGKIYAVGLNGKFNHRKISDMFDEFGIPLYDPGTDFMSRFFAHTANYTLKPIAKYNTFVADIAASAYWEDYLPLSYFAKYVKDYEGASIYDLDYLQFNLDYPQKQTAQAGSSTGFWTYNDLRVRYEIPVVLTYEDLDNALYTGWANYEAMSFETATASFFNTTNDIIRAYVTFQKITDGANKNLRDYSNIKVALSSGIVDPDTLTDDWETTAYEVLDNTIIYPPKLDQNDSPISFENLALVYHIEITSPSLTRQPVRMRDLQIASNVLERASFTKIGTRFGVPVYPFYKRGLYYVFKGKNPITLHKESTPYLYTTNNSGFRIRGEFSPSLERGISIPINTEQALGVEISSLQMWIKYSEIDFPTSDQAIATINFKNTNYAIMLRADESTERGYIYLKNTDTNATITDAEYYLNGNKVSDVFILKDSWSVLAIRFAVPLSFDGVTGRINLVGPLTYNNIAFFLSSSLQRVQSITPRTWQRVKQTSGSPTPNDWQFWADEYIWENVAILAFSNAFALDPEVVYKTYLGTNRSVTSDTSGRLKLDQESSRVFRELIWSSQVKSAVQYGILVAMDDSNLLNRVGKVRKQVIDKNYDWGLYVYKKSNGKWFTDGTGGVLNIEAYKGDLSKIAELKQAAKYYGDEGDGECVFVPGLTRISDELYSEQVDRMSQGLIPSENDLGAYMAAQNTLDTYGREAYEADE